MKLGTLLGTDDPTPVTGFAIDHRKVAPGNVFGAFAGLKEHWDGLDIVVHSVAFAPREALAGGFVESTTRESFRIAHDVSSYSLTLLARAALPMMAGRNGALLTMSYLGAVKSIPSYNVMGLAKASLES